VKGPFLLFLVTLAFLKYKNQHPESEIILKKITVKCLYECVDEIPETIYCRDDGGDLFQGISAAKFVRVSDVNEKLLSGQVEGTPRTERERLAGDFPAAWPMALQCVNECGL